MPVYKAPPELKSKIRQRFGKKTSRNSNGSLSTGGHSPTQQLFVVLSCALAWTWFSLSPSKDQALIAEAISNHSRSLMVSHLVDCASSDQYKVRPWFNGKLDYSPPVPDLTQAGYTLVGGRVDILEQRPVAAIVYQHGKTCHQSFRLAG